jgi:phosphopantetheine--protein transferase-like protein
MMKDVVGCGIDIEELVRFRTMIPVPPNSRGFSDLVYTTEEITCNLGITPALTFPLSFSCKEAFFKAFGVSWTNSRISWKDIELIFSNSDDLRKYSIRLGGYAEELFHEKNCSLIKSSLGYTDTYVMFQVVLLS